VSAELVETPDAIGAFPRLSEQQIQAIEARGERRPVADGDVLFREGDPSYDFIVVLDGLVETFEEFAGQERLLAVHGPGRFLGDLNVITGGSPFFTAVARQPGEVLAVTPAALRQVLTDDPALGDLVLRAYLLRRTLLIELGVGNKLIGSSHSPDTRRLRDFLARNRVPHEWIDLEHDEQAERVLVALGVAPEETPIVICRGEIVLRNPSTAEVATALGLRSAQHAEPSVDLLVIGAGPAGLAASVYGASEGLRTVTVDAVATGGQAATSSRIENYLGFPAGISGGELAERAALQARKFGATILVPGEAASIAFEDSAHTLVRLADGDVVEARAVVLATGARYRKLDVPRLDELEGSGVYYAATLMELPLCLNRPVVVVGGGNSAGQATVFFSEYAAHVWLVAREEDLSANMSRYLVDRIERAKRVDVLLHTEVRELVGDAELEGVVVEDTQTGERRTLEASALFVFIGADPCTSWLAAAVALDRHGFVLTGPDLDGARRADGREPLLLETSLPGVFAAGDVRSGSVKRVAAAVGEGAMAVQFVHRYLAERAV
jgi:thioredoxin reductase (NADPH)